MKTKRATSVALSRTVLAAAITLVLVSPAYAVDPDTTSSRTAADQAVTADRAATAERANTAERAATAERDASAARAAAADRTTAAERATAGGGKDADNTAHNERDAGGNTVTPFDQSHADSDVEMTRSIRKMLVDDDTLGTNAQNVKVITVDGKVTLRGPVANATEQARVVAIAKKAAGPDRVVSEIEVIKR